MDWQQAAAVGGVGASIVTFLAQHHQATKATIRDTYTRLELASNEVFRFEAANAAALQPFKASSRPDRPLSPEGALLAENYYLQQLNLFEIAVRFRRTGAVDKVVFGSWVAWFFEALQSWSFRAAWRDTRLHYTPELRAIFDGPVEMFDPSRDEIDNRRAFFRHVAKTIGCPIIENWISDARVGKLRK